MHSWQYTVACTAVFSLCFLVTGSVVSKHLLLVYREHNSATPDSDKNEECDTRFDIAVIDYGTLVSVLSFFAVIALALAMCFLEFATATGLYPCKAQPLVCGQLLIAAKCAMYAVFVARIRVCFDGTVYAYSKRTIGVMYAAVVFDFVLFSCVHPFVSDAHWEQTHYAANGRRVQEKGGKRAMAACVIEMNEALFSAMLMFDVVFSVAVVVMFTRPLKHLLKRSRESESQSTAEPERAEFELLPLKCMLLSAAAVASTFLTIALSATTGTGILFPIDNSVNVACLLLMTAPWRACYWRLCGPLLRCLSTAPCVAEHNRANIAIISTNRRQHMSAISNF